MAGHSKWANPEVNAGHRKKRRDAKRGKPFTRLIREIRWVRRQPVEPIITPNI